MKNKFENNKSKAKGPKPIVVTVPLVVTGQDAKGNEYNTESCKAIMNNLQNFGCFDKLSVNVMIAREHLMTDGKGITVLGRLQKYNTETEEIELLLIGKNTVHADIVTDMVIVPRVLLARNSTEVSSILSFEIVPAMEA